MDRRVMDYLMDKMDSRRGRRDRERDRARDSRDYEDNRRGVRGSGRGDRRDSCDTKMDVIMKTSVTMKMVVDVLVTKMVEITIIKN